MSRTNIDEIKARVPIDDLIGSYIKIEKAGKSFKAKCPFHNEKTASFFISPERGGYYCFGCGAKGDIFNFVEQFEGLDFKGALKVLAERSGVPLVFGGEVDNEKDKLFSLMELTATYFEEQFAKSKEAQDYVKSRGIQPATREAFRIGWAPDGWMNLHDYLMKKGWADALLEKAGLIKMKERNLRELPSGSASNSYYDRFRGRIMFPISDSSGRIVAFTGRILKDDGKSAKYLNSPETTLYDKSGILFGLDKAKKEIRRMDYTIMVEGQMDLIMSYQAGVRNVVAASGTALSDESVNKQGIVNNLGLVRRLSQNLIIAFDSDNAGRKAAFRAAGIALSLGMDVKMADIVGGKDPADLVRENPEIWKDILRKTKPVVEFEFLNVLKDEKDQRKLGRALRERVFPLLSSIESRTDQDYFVKMIADKANIDAGAIWEDLRTIKKRLDSEAEKMNGQSSNMSANNSKLSPEHTQTHDSPHLDLVERRMFGLLNLIKKQDKEKYEKYLKVVEGIAGDLFAAKMERANLEMNDISFEAEAFFGDDRSRWDVHMSELIANFEEDLINNELVKAMQELRIAEKSGNHALVTELVGKCQALSKRKSEVKRSKSH